MFAVSSGYRQKTKESERVERERARERVEYSAKALFGAEQRGKEKRRTVRDGKSGDVGSSVERRRGTRGQGDNCRRAPVRVALAKKS